MTGACNHYRGRFAPSPTGPLHAGSLVAALASYLDAKAHNGNWHVRIDDIDPPRAATGATDRILNTLAAHGLKPDGPVHYQSEHSQRYDAALDRLADKGLTFLCQCTRATLGPGGVCISDCATRRNDHTRPGSIRIRVAADFVSEFTDVIRGAQRLPLGEDCANFIVRRRDGLYAYQLACAVDDDARYFSHVMRGADLLHSSHRQRYLHHCLDISSPSYGHVPIVTDPAGNKLSKQAGAPAIDDQHTATNLNAALAALGQVPVGPDNPAATMLTQAIAQWDRARVPR